MWFYSMNSSDSDEGLSPSEMEPPPPPMDDNNSKMEVIEVGGAWKQMIDVNQGKESTPPPPPPPMENVVVEIPLDDIEPVTGE